MARGAPSRRRTALLWRTAAALLWRTAAALLWRIAAALLWRTAACGGRTPTGLRGSER